MKQETELCANLEQAAGEIVRLVAGGDEVSDLQWQQLSTVLNQVAEYAQGRDFLPKALCSVLFEYFTGLRDLVLIGDEYSERRTNFNLRFLLSFRAGYSFMKLHENKRGQVSFLSRYGPARP